MIRHEFAPHASTDKMFGGALIGLRSRDSLTFYDWDQTATICCLDEIVPNNIYWYEPSTPP